MHRRNRRRERSFDDPLKRVAARFGVWECDEEHFNGELYDIVTRATVARVSPSVVQIVSRHVPDDMAAKGCGFNGSWYVSGEKVFVGSGFIIECEEEAAGDGTYSNIALTHAALFQRTNGVQPHEIQVDVYLSDDKLCNGEVFACDFHYNLAAVRFRSETPLQIAKLRGLDEVITIDPAKRFCLRAEKSFELCPHSNLFKILPGDKLVAIGRCKGPLFACGDYSSFFSMEDLKDSEDSDCLEKSPFPKCGELRSVDGVINNEYFNGGPLINSLGDVVGIMLCDSSFLPTNVVSRWWEHYKSRRQYRRPWIGFDVANLYAADLKFLEKFVQKFPNIFAGVLVTKVQRDSLAYTFGIRPFDVIVQFDGKLVHNTLECFEKIWESGKSVKLGVARASNGIHMDLTTTIVEATPSKFYRWRTPGYMEYKQRFAACSNEVTYDGTSQQ